MKRVVTKITRVKGGWDGTVDVDGEFYAGASAGFYLDVATAVQAYVVSLFQEASATGGDQ